MCVHVNETPSAVNTPGMNGVEGSILSVVGCGRPFGGVASPPEACMGVILAFVPAVGYTWPALFPVALAVGAAMGYKIVSETKDPTLMSKLTRKLMNTQQVKLNVKTLLNERERPINIEVMQEELTSDQFIRFERGPMSIVFSKDTRGNLTLQIFGPAAMSKRQLHDEGVEFASRLVQAFAVNRIVEEMEKVNATVVEEQREENEEIVLTLRRWV